VEGARRGHLPPNIRAAVLSWVRECVTAVVGRVEASVDDGAFQVGTPREDLRSVTDQGREAKHFTFFFLSSFPHNYVCPVQQKTTQSGDICSFSKRMPSVFLI
jgi:hypothetical protein